MLIDASTEEFHQFLRSRQILLVHFSGTPKGVGVETFFPFDLLYACAHDTSTPLSCSTVGAVDRFNDVPGCPRNATGSIGLVLACRGPHSIMSTDGGDGGAPIEKIDRPTIMAECKASVEMRAANAYNEFNITDFDIVGILAVLPMTVDDGSSNWEGIDGAADTPPEYLMGGSTREFRRVDEAELLQTFQGKRMFTFRDGELLEWLDANWTPITFEDIYPHGS